MFQELGITTEVKEAQLPNRLLSGNEPPVISGRFIDSRL